MNDEIQNTDAYHIQLDIFEGPLDLLLHLIKENRMDIYNIPIAQITEQYLGYIDMMKELNLDIAGEFLLMAATLAHLKSQLLLPPDESQQDAEEEGQDPRAELVRRLLEYQKYKNAAEQLVARPQLYRDVFARTFSARAIPKSDAPAELVEISVFKLVEAFHHVLAHVKMESPHQISFENVTIPDCVDTIVRAIRVSDEGSIRFQDLFKGVQSRRKVVVTFLAVLDLLKRGVIRVFQADAFSEIQLLGTQTLYGDWKYDGRDEYTTGQSTDTQPEIHS
jgi:segregation and condensation protein A